MATTRQATLNAPVAVQAPTGVITRGTADFEWCIEDPAAVRMTFHSPGAEPVEWLTARWQLMAGIGDPTFVGDGDVLIRREGVRAVRLRFLSDLGTADVLVPREMLVRFLDACEEACPVGSPAEDERVAAWVGAFLLSLGIPS